MVHAPTAKHVDTNPRCGYALCILAKDLVLHGVKNVDHTELTRIFDFAKNLYSKIYHQKTTSLYSLSASIIFLHLLVPRHFGASFNRRMITQFQFLV